MSAGAEAGGGRLDHDLVAPAAQRGIVGAERPDLAVTDRPRPSPRGGGHRRATPRGTAVASPNDACASAAACSMTASNSASSSTRRIPARPPPAAALSITGKPSAAAASTAASAPSSGLAVPRHDRQPGALGDQLDGDPVAHAAEHLGIGAEEPARRGGRRWRRWSGPRPPAPIPATTRRRRRRPGRGRARQDRHRRQRRPNRPPARSHRFDSDRRAGRPRGAAARVRRRPRGRCG